MITLTIVVIGPVLSRKVFILVVTWKTKGVSSVAQVLRMSVTTTTSIPASQAMRTIGRASRA